jgi:hypothetical protein
VEKQKVRHSLINPSLGFLCGVLLLLSGQYSTLHRILNRVAFIRLLSSRYLTGKVSVGLKILTVQLVNQTIASIT